MTWNDFKKMAGMAALEYIEKDMVIGVGTGSTVSYFIDGLKRKKNIIRGAVSSSTSSTNKLKEIGVSIIDSNDVDYVDIYVDGVDEFNNNLMMIKGGGAALTREKVIAAMAKKFIAIADESKKVTILGKSSLPVEVIPMAKSYVIRELKKLGGIPKHRKHVITDNGNIIVDVYRLKIFNPTHLEDQINSIAGVITVGLFANRPADIVLLATHQGIKRFFCEDN
ncbi:ribose-5-phosphate isomerase RpiA [Candidatus Riesia pediculicola]|uniref:Ribose-5-phosphate isomerase A n=1 Tax=Riesia pediculicola (strain USDA) TaxID=515618 RepID=D4G7S8_RIEPU|nr:ribose-5-phosphate isomerase RpiA [Candidatus Riesia pediculicola]ADD79410.1 ribose 5-phosphate isomerase A [Candidatus Riesia pediculicola USDA]ARC53647.1 ribose 5-phosphate isomerase [Candidatus Riesia pediculicola]ARC54111.1 ribose 5-phosphate isomerase [Candidatus Riesia pediculicola]QOJ86297.1 ribose-5-phosphate isomerase RpiA [Candidatus Riesia pediculicola]